jgi:NAD(P)-dependent dehydrogenase (short-subunit alcohol dehydrogenase family)
MSAAGKSAISVVVVTGASAGVGRATAIAFARRGAKIGLLARDKDALEIVAAEIAALGSTASVVALDVTDPHAVEDAAARFESELGPIDLWVNDAMVTVFSPVSEISADEFRRVTEVTYLGVVYGTLAALHRMRPRQKGHIINIGSALAYRGIPLQAAYCGAKHAIRGFTTAVRSELFHEKSEIDISIIELPAMNTPQFDWARNRMPRDPKPMGTIYQPEVAARAVVRAAQTRPREFWVGASTFWTIVGNMVAPDVMDWFLAHSAVNGQQTEELASKERRDNLYEPVGPLHRTRGSFSEGARERGMVVAGSWARLAVVAAGAGIFFLLGAASKRPVRPRRSFFR